MLVVLVQHILDVLKVSSSIPQMIMVLGKKPDLAGRKHLKQSPLILIPCPPPHLGDSNRMNGSIRGNLVPQIRSFFEHCSKSR